MVMDLGGISTLDRFPPVDRSGGYSVWSCSLGIVMTDQEVLEKYNALEEHWGDKLANFEHHPRQFAYQVALFNYYNERKQNEDRSMQ